MVELRPPLPGFRHNPIRLVAILAGQSTMTFQGLLAAEAQLVFPCAVGRDLCRPGAAPPLLLEVALDLLPARTARFHILVVVSLDLRRAILSPLDFVPKVLQSIGELRLINRR